MPLFDRQVLAGLAEYAPRIARTISAAVKVLIVTVGSIVAVVFASLIISIIQFQLRLSEARTQNGNITLEAIQLTADYQDNVSNRYKQMRQQADQLNALRTDYMSKLNSTTQLITNICSTLDPDKLDACYARLQYLINDKNSKIDAALAELGPKAPENIKNGPMPVYIDNFKQIVASGALLDAQTKFFNTQSFVQSECQTLTQYVSDRFGASSLLGVSPELRMTIVVQCYSGGLEDPPPAQPQMQSISIPAVSEPAGRPSAADISGVNRVLLSELVFYYKFYDWLTSFAGTDFRHIILSPPEFIVILLVIATGILGSFLFHSYTMFRAKDSSEFPTFFSIGLRATLSVMCALVIYILSRTGFVAITEGSRHTAETTISPFVIAFISVAAGLMAEKALERIKLAGEAALSGGGKDTEAERAGTTENQHA
jgi:hypothetical protein